MLTYNSLLFEERRKRHLTVRQMAKNLGIFTYIYRMIENGYIKPNKKQVQRISDFLQIDYAPYLDHEPSYPAELPEKPKRKIVKVFYQVIGHISFKITFALLTLMSIGVMVTGIVGEKYTNTHQREHFSSAYLQFFDKLSDNGMVHISISDVLLRPEYYITEKNEETHESKYISIMGSYDKEAVKSLKFTATYRTDEYRLIYAINPIQRNDDIRYTVKASLSYYSEYQTVVGNYIQKDNGEFITTTISKDKTIYNQSTPEYEQYNPILTSKFSQFEDDFTNTITKWDDTCHFSLRTLCKNYADAAAKISVNLVTYMVLKYVGIILTGLTLFTLIFAFIYGTYKGKVVDYRPAQLEIPIDEEKPLKKDIRFCPFIPETLLEIVGIFLVFIGSFRSIFYVSGLVTGTLGTVLQSTVGRDFTSLFMVGMFLLYFVDFDIFMDDKRVFRNIFLYGIVYICLYVLEVLIIRGLQNGSIIFQLSDLMMIPNMFGSISCYFMIMMFLFYTPKWIKKKWMLVVYRCLAILPITLIIVFWLMSAGNGVFYNHNWSLEVKYLFNGEKIPFSILAILYLVGLYFLRLFFEKKYGIARAKIFFNGNKFLWIKNIFASLIVLGIGIMEICLASVPLANKMGLGLYKNVLFLIPLLLFYHPHKGPRNVYLDYVTLGLYIIAVSFSYLIVAMIVILFLF